MRRARLLAAALAAAAAGALPAQTAPGDRPPLLRAGHGEAIAAELSGTSALRTVQAMSLHHRMRGSQLGRAPVEEVAEYLETLARLGVLEAVRR